MARKSQVHNEAPNNTDNESKPSVESILEKIIERQEKFERETTEAYNRMAEKLNGIFAEFQKVNPVANDTSITIPQVQQIQSYIDENGINWGQKKDEFAKKKDNVNVLGSLGLNAETIAVIVSKLLDSFMNKGSQTNNIMMELMMRNFMEDLEQSKLMKHAFNNMLLKKNLIDMDMFNQVRETTETLSKPIHDMVQKMKGVESGKSI